MKIGSLCTGYGGLDMAVEAYFGAETVWCAEYDKYASQVIAERFNITNYGNIKSINWAELEPIDILTAGYPCQPFSQAGYRKGTNDERHVFPYILEAISTLRPRWVILENVRGHLSLGLKEVLAGLASIGYDARWKIVRASDVGAPHQRKRLFVIAYPTSFRCQNKLRDSQPSEPINSITSDAYRSGFQRWDETVLSKREIESRHGSKSAFTNSNHARRFGSMQGFQGRFNSRYEMSMQKAPNTLDQLGRLNPEFVEYMMGLPSGWVTGTGLPRTQQLKMLGNGVVPQQAYYALEQLMELDTHFEQDLS